MKISKGSPRQFRRAVETQIARLDGDHDIESATSIEGTSGSPDELKTAVKDRIAELGGRTIEECYAEPIEGLDEIESAVEPGPVGRIIEEDNRKFPVQDVLDFLENKGYDISNEAVKNYADGVAAYMDMSRMAYEHGDMDWPYDLDQWYKDTMQNYPDELLELQNNDIEGACNSCNVPAANDVDDDILSTDFDNAEVTYDVVEAAEDTDEQPIELDEYDQIYLGKLEKSLDEWVDDPEATHNVQSMTYEHDDDNLYITVTRGEGSNVEISEYTIPFDDEMISFNEENIDEDTEFILRAILHDENVEDVTDSENEAEDIETEDANVESSTEVKANYAGIDGYDAADYAGGYTEWELIDVKSVKDFDDFWTDYTMWHNPITDQWVCIFGDREIYYPENADYDWECESEEECREWFDNYRGPGEDDDDIFESTGIDNNDDNIESNKDCEG